MLNRIISYAVEAVLTQVLQQRIRDGSILAVKGYITAIKGLRMAFLGLFGLGVASAVLVVGVALALVGAMALLPIGPTGFAISLLAIGLILSLLAGIGLGLLFSQRRWLEVSRSYELMDAVLQPWPGLLPPNPVDILKGRGMEDAVARRGEGLPARMEPPQENPDDDRDLAYVDSRFGSRIVPQTGF